MPSTSPIAQPVRQCRVALSATAQLASRWWCSCVVMARSLTVPPRGMLVRPMPSIRRQLATFFAVLAVLYAGGFIAGQFIETGEDSHGGGDRQHERR